jgi:hypothetical protein
MKSQSMTVKVKPKPQNNKEYVHQVLEMARSRKARKEAQDEEDFRKQLHELEQMKQEKLKAAHSTQPSGTTSHFSRRKEPSRKEIIPKSPPVKESSSARTPISHQSSRTSLNSFKEEPSHRDQSHDNFVDRVNNTFERHHHSDSYQQIYNDHMNHLYKTDLQHRIEEKADRFLRVTDGKARRDLNIPFSPPTKHISNYVNTSIDDFDPYDTGTSRNEPIHVDPIIQPQILPTQVQHREYEQILYPENDIKNIDEQEKLVKDELTQLEARLEAHIGNSPEKLKDEQPARKRPTSFIVKPLDLQKLSAFNERPQQSQRDIHDGKKKMLVRSTVTSRRRSQSASRTRSLQQAEKELEEKRLFKPKINQSVMGNSFYQINTFRSRASSAGPTASRTSSHNISRSLKSLDTSNAPSRIISSNNSTVDRMTAYDPDEEEEMGPSVKATFVQLKHLMIRDEEFKRVMGDIKVAEKNLVDLYERNLEQSKIQRQLIQEQQSLLKQQVENKSPAKKEKRQIKEKPISNKPRPEQPVHYSVSLASQEQYPENLEIIENRQLERDFEQTDSTLGSSSKIKHAMSVKLEQLQESLSHLTSSLSSPLDYHQGGSTHVRMDKPNPTKKLNNKSISFAQQNQQMNNPQIQTFINPGEEENTLAITTYITTPPNSNLTLDQIKKVRSTTRVLSNNDEDAPSAGFSFNQHVNDQPNTDNPGFHTSFNTPEKSIMNTRRDENPLLKIINKTSNVAWSPAHESPSVEDRRQRQHVATAGDNTKFRSFVSTAFHQPDEHSLDYETQDVALSPKSAKTVALFERHMQRKKQHEKKPDTAPDQENEFLKKFEYFEKKIKKDYGS